MIRADLEPPAPLPFAMRSARRLALLLAPACALVSSPAAATPTPCPVNQGFAVCNLVDGDAELEVRATSRSDGQQILVSALDLDGINQIGLGSAQGFALYDLDTLAPAQSDLVSASVDPATRTIEVQLTGVGGTFQVSASFVLTGDDTVAVLDESFTVTPLVNGLNLRVYSVTDYDIDGDLEDESIDITGDGAVTTQVDGETTGTVEVVAGPLPDDFEIAVCCNLLLDIIYGSVPLALSGSTTVPGPEDFVSALSWDRTLDVGQDFQVALRKTVVPEPAHALAAAAAALLALAMGRRVGR